MCSVQADVPAGSSTSTTEECKPAISRASRATTLSSTSGPPEVFPQGSSLAVSKPTSLQFTTVHSPSERRKRSSSTDAKETSCAVARNMPVTRDVEGSLVVLSRKSSSVGQENLSVPEENLTQVNRESVDVTGKALPHVTDKVDESCVEVDLSRPELPVVGSTTRRARPTSKQTKIIRRQTKHEVKSYCLRRRHSTGDGGNETQSVFSAPDLARFLTSPRNTNRGRTYSDIYEFHSDGHESPHKSRGRCLVVQGGVRSEAERNSSDSDRSFVFPLPPHVTRSCCTSLECLCDIRDKQLSGRLRKRSSLSESDVGTKVTEGPEKQLPLSQLSKCGIEAGIETVRQFLRKARSELASSEERSGLPEESPVASRLRRRSGGKSDVDASEVVVVSAGSPKKFHPSSCGTKPSHAASDSLPKSSRDTSSGSPVKPAGSPQKMAQSPKADRHLKRFSSSTSSLEDADVSSHTQKRSVTSCSPSARSQANQHSSSLTSPRSRPQEDRSESETKTRRSQRLIAKNKSRSSSSPQRDKSPLASPTR